MNKYYLYADIKQDRNVKYDKPIRYAEKEVNKKLKIVKKVMTRMVKEGRK